uniref:Uncharacterized protein n=1 Tax=Oryza brachyantha TaxID=4533 RepID=J3KX80_ORYBR
MGMRLPTIQNLAFCWWRPSAGRPSASDKPIPPKNEPRPVVSKNGPGGRRGTASIDPDKISLFPSMSWSEHACRQRAKL